MYIKPVFLRAKSQLSPVTSRSRRQQEGEKWDECDLECDDDLKKDEDDGHYVFDHLEKPKCPIFPVNAEFTNSLPKSGKFNKLLSVL